MKNLYRRYRPLKLTEVVGQPQVTEPLNAALNTGKVSHAYLFVGPRGCGKTSVARILAHEVNGFSYEVEDDYIDIIEIDGASNRGIDNIRELREKAATRPTAGKYKVYIIDEVHMLTKEAFNALLKTLEEPPEHVIFIMATTDAYKVPVTITSRAQTYTFRLADRQTMLDFLKSVCEKEKIAISDEALMLVAKRGGGSFRDSLSLLDQISTLSDGEITKELVEKAIGLPEDEKITELINEYISGDVAEITTSLKELLSSGIKAETIAEEMIASIIENPGPSALPLLAKLPDVKAPFAEARLLIALCDGVLSLESRLGARPVMRDSRTGDLSAPSVRGLASSERHTLGSRENRPSGEPLGAVRNIRSSSANQSSMLTEEAKRSLTDITHGEFDWNGFLEKVRGMNDAIYAQVAKAAYNVSGDTLKVYPEKKIAKTILSRVNNKKILIDAAGGLKVEILDAGENPHAKKDELISKISDIMGGEVQNDGGGSPF